MSFEFLIAGLNDVLTAGIAINALSLLMYALTFNLRDRVARSFALILGCMVIVFAGEAMGSVTQDRELQELWFKLEFVGLVFLPPAYFHFSDALLATTGRPSRGRRRLAVRLMYLLSVAFLLGLPSGRLVGGLVIRSGGVAHLEPTTLTWVFAFFYLVFSVWAWLNFRRAYERTQTTTSRRRMRYLLVASIGPPAGAFPYLLFGGDVALSQPFFFWLVAVAANVFVFFFLVLMAYAVAFFGVFWPDRVVKRRLAKWMLRGPVTAFVVLGTTTFTRRAGALFGLPDSIMVPVIMVITILVMEHLISLGSPLWERLFFTSGEGDNLQTLQTLEERMLTTSDLRQYLESVLAAVVDQFQSSTAFIAAIGTSGIELIVPVSTDNSFSETDLADNMLDVVDKDNGDSHAYLWGDYWVVPLYGENEQLVGMMGVDRNGQQEIDEEQDTALLTLGQRVALALDDRFRLEQVFSAIRDLTPQVELVQRLRAASRYDREGVLVSPADLPASVDLAQAVKDALSHYWGGPKLTDSPLMRLQVVQQAMEEQDSNPVNALRAILKEGIQRVRPEGERRFTAEWILYNILELKFMEGRKVREVAMRLAVSEADLYRKQRVAIEAVAEAILEMEKQAQQEGGSA